MARSQNWQESGIRIGGRTLTEKEVTQIVTELRKKVHDPQAIQEMEEFLSGKRDRFSAKVQSALLAALTALMMMRSE